MQIFLHTDPNVDGSQRMAEHVETVVKGALDHFGEQVTRVEVHLSDVNSNAKAGDKDILCTLEARLAGLQPVVTKDHAATAHQAIQGAADKLKRAVGSALEKHR